MKRFVLLVFVISLLLSCSNPLSKVYTEENFLLDMAEIKESKGEESVKLITSYVMMQTLKTSFNDESEDVLAGKTYKELLEDAENYKIELQRKEEEEKMLALEEEKRKKEVSLKISESLTFALTEKGFNEYKYQEYLTFTFTFKNKTNREILGVKGIVTFFDIFDDEIKKLRLSYDEGIRGGQTINYFAQTDYNQFISEDIKLKNTDLSKLKVVWEPQQLIFNDGEKITLD